MSSGYEQIYESLIPKLGQCDFSEIAERLALKLHSDDSLHINFLGREYEISSHGVNPIDGKPVDINNRSVLAYYALSEGNVEPAFSYVQITYFAGTVITGTNLKWMTDPLGKTLNKNYEKFSETMCKLGGIFCDKQKSGCYSWILKVLPKIPLQILYYDGDDEFPCEIQIMFDENAACFMEFECLAFLEGCLVRAMIMTAQTGNTDGWV